MNDLADNTWLQFGDTLVRFTIKEGEWVSTKLPSGRVKAVNESS